LALAEEVIGDWEVSKESQEGIVRSMRKEERVIAHFGYKVVPNEGEIPNM
jgi:hypothetical protein